MKRAFLNVAEMIDAFRVVPRLVLIGYSWLVYYITMWYIDYPIRDVTKCDASVLNTLLTSGVELELARTIACQVTDVVGHPNGYTVLVSTVIGAAAVVFGLYSNSGRRWGDKTDRVDSVPHYNNYSNYNRSPHTNFGDLDRHPNHQRMDDLR